MKAFEELAEQRFALRSFCRSHYPSLMYFSGGTSFYLNEHEAPFSSEDLRHITSSVTCYSSLLECPVGFREPSATSIRLNSTSIDPKIAQLTFEEKVQRFTNGILGMPVNRWISDESARVYCECRTLPFAIKNASHWNDSIRKHILHVLEQLVLVQGRVAIGEADPREQSEDWYPPNAYHTFWILKALEELQTRFSKQYSSISQKLDLPLKMTGMRRWARQTLAFQTSLHAASSSTLDTDQLIWSLAILCSDPSLSQTKLEEQDFVRPCVVSSVRKLKSVRGDIMLLSSITKKQAMPTVMCLNPSLPCWNAHFSPTQAFCAAASRVIVTAC